MKKSDATGTGNYWPGRLMVHGEWSNFGSRFMIKGSYLDNGSGLMATYGSLLMVHGEGLMATYGSW